VTLIRGFGRLDTFPGNDSSVAANLALVAPGVTVDAEHIMEMLGSQRGVLYFFSATRAPGDARRSRSRVGRRKRERHGAGYDTLNRAPTRANGVSEAGSPFSREKR
jgi:hypothetical protein